MRLHALVQRSILTRRMRRAQHVQGIVLACTVALACDKTPSATKPQLTAVATGVRVIDSEGFDQLRDVERLSDDIVAVVSGDGTHVALSDRDGGVQNVGKRGSGPGEFRNVVAITAMGSGRYLTLDVGNRRVSLWGLREGYLESRTLPGLINVGPWSTKNGAVMKVTAPGQSGGQLQLISSPTGELLDSSKVAATVPGSCMFCNMSVGPDGSVASTNDPVSYTVTLRNAHGDSTATIVVNRHPLVVLSQAELDSAAAWRASQYDRMRASGLSDESIKRLLTTYVAAKTRGRFVQKGVRHDPLGRIWLQRIVAPGRGGEVDVFSAAGEELGTIVLPPNFRITRVYTNEILGLRTNADGTMQVTFLNNPMAERGVAIGREGTAVR